MTELENLFSVVLVLQSSVQALDDTVSEVDQVNNLVKFCPTEEEAELVEVTST